MGTVRGRGGGRGGGRGRGQRGRGGKREPVPTAEELDADLEAYRDVSFIAMFVFIYTNFSLTVKVLSLRSKSLTRIHTRLNLFLNNFVYFYM